jgi:hypothetical protein
MPIAVSVQLPITTKDPREAIGECIRLIRKNVGFLDQLEIDLGLVCTANRGVLIHLAELLPAKALGFRCSGSDRAITADQFRRQESAGLCIFNGKLTEHFLPMDALRLIEELLARPPQAIRSTAFNFNVDKIQWKGAPPDCSGALHLFDLKAFKRTARFSLSVSLKMRGENPTAPEVKEMLKEVTQATGIAFEKGRIVRTASEKKRSPEHGDAVLVGQICFDEAIENITGQLPGQWISEFAPASLSPREAFAQRMQQWGSEGSVKVNLAPVIKAAMKELMPELKFKAADAEQILFCKSLGSSSEIIAIFSKALPRIGKAFTLSLGVHCLEENLRFAANIFQFERSTEHKTWIYRDVDEARAVVNEAVNLIKALLPRFESSILPYFRVWPKELPAGIEQHGDLTAWQAFEKAKPLACKLFPDAALIRIANHSRSLKMRDIEGPELSMDGRLRKNGAWWFHFYSAKRDVSFQITVPFVGRIRVLNHGKQYQDPNARYILEPAGEEWMDSDRAFSLAEERGGRARRESGRAFGISTKLQMSASQRPYWGIMYLIVDERGRNDLIVHMDAITGEAMNDIRGF